VDSKMPMMDGFELVQRIKSQPRLQDLPVVLLAAMSEADKFRDVENLSQIYLTTRPVQVSELRETVQQALERKKVVPVVAPQKRLAIPEPPRPPPPRPSQASIATRGFERVAVPANAAIRKDLRILLAEDNAVNQKVTSLLLKKLGFVIDVVNNGKQAVEAIEQGAYDIVLMDKQMPEMDGIEATMRIRSMTHVRQPVVIALTASASLEDEVACKQANMDHFLTKPVQFEKVKEALAFATDLMTRRSRASLPGGD
ncbi:MAG TPA: response regulator, partial [Opitutales bacterium]|nr:response regulator [Opitutales bacterium]